MEIMYAPYIYFPKPNNWVGLIVVNVRAVKILSTANKRLAQFNAKSLQQLPKTRIF